jgi:hypothetical protein
MDICFIDTLCDDNTLELAEIIIKTHCENTTNIHTTLIF